MALVAACTGAPLLWSAAEVYKGSTIFTAHCGDCRPFNFNVSLEACKERCVIGLERTGGLVLATEDHKPDVVKEQAWLHRPAMLMRGRLGSKPLAERCAQRSSRMVGLPGA